MTTPDKCHRLLHMMGFSVGEVAFDLPDGRREWQVDASRDGQTVLAKALTQQAAWESVTRMVGRLIRRGVLLIAILIVAGCGPSASEQAEDIVSQGMLRHKVGDPANAVKCYTFALEVDPTSADAHIWRAMAYDDLGKMAEKKADLEQAKALLGEAINRHPKDTKLYVTRAEAYSLEGDTEAALADCNRAVELDPTDADMFEGRAAIYMLRGDLDKALADLTEAIRLGPFKAEYYMARGEVWRRMGKPDKAEADFAVAEKAGGLTGESVEPLRWGMGTEDGGPNHPSSGDESTKP